MALAGYLRDHAAGAVLELDHGRSFTLAALDLMKEVRRVLHVICRCTYRLQLETKFVACLPRTRDMILCRTVAAAHNGASTRVAQCAFLTITSSDQLKDLRMAEQFDAHVHPAVLWNSADALNKAQSGGVGEGDLGYEYRTKNVYPCLALRGLACA